MLSANNDYGGWWSYEGVVTNIKTCSDYIDEVDGFYDVRSWRVKNLLNATLLGYGNRADVDLQWREIVRGFRDRINFDSAFVKEADETWDWEEVWQDVRRMSDADRKMVLDNLKKRVKTSAKRNGEENKFKHRTALEIFVNMLKDI
jgi:hypothetical protein